jgi:hypothetical protein
MAMKKLNFSLLALLPILLFACGGMVGDVVTFTEPQPVGKNNLARFPNNLQGEYLSENGRSSLYIDSKFIRRRDDLSFKMHVSELDSNYRIIGDTIFAQLEGEKWPIVREEDSLKIENFKVDTIFQIDDKNILKKYKDTYFLNKSWEDNGWGVLKIETSKEALKLSSITEEEVESLKKVGKETLDSVPYRFEFNNKNFLDFVKDGGFKNSETFINRKK